MLPDADEPSRDAPIWEDQFQKHFGHKWGTDSSEGRKAIMDRIRQADGHPIRISKGDVNEAFAAIRRKKVKDHYGACVGSLFLMWHACPTVLLEFLAELIADTAWISSLCVRGRVFGKECPTTPVDKTRAILPLPALLQLIDALLPRLVGTHFARILPQVPECFVGARPRTQVLDITHGIQSVIEKGLDDFGSAACVQCDIQQFYDSLPLVRIFDWLVAQGLPVVLAAALMRHQVCPLVILQAKAAATTLVNRSCGGLTGSRVAGLLGRVPVEAVFCARAAAWRPWAIQSNDATWQRNTCVR